MPTMRDRNAHGRFVRHYYCDSCQMLSINGLPCHETGCPDTWMDELRECRHCGTDFTPSERYQACCDEDCARTFYGE